MKRVYELIQACDREALFEAYVKSSELPRVMTEAQCAAFREKFMVFLDMLDKLTPKPDDDTVVINSVSYDLDMERTVLSRCYSVKLLQEKIGSIGFFEAVAGTVPEELTDAEAEAIYECVTDYTRTTEDAERFDGELYMFTEWDKVLGWLVSEASVAELGEIASAAAILEQMTFCGFDPEKKRAEERKLNGMLRESESLTSEEALQDAVPFEEVFPDERTPEEKAQDTRNQHRSLVLTALYCYRAMQDFLSL